jgi:hypothetical protein
MHQEEGEPMSSIECMREIVRARSMFVDGAEDGEDHKVNLRTWGLSTLDCIGLSITGMKHRLEEFLWLWR